jgi:hypothetical protein
MGALPLDSYHDLLALLHSKAKFEIATLLEPIPTFPKGKATNPQNLGSFKYFLFKLALCGSEVLPSGGFRWAFTYTNHHLH